MGFRKLCDRKGTPMVSLDKGDLQIDGVVDEDGEIPNNQEMHVQRLGEGGYLIRVVDEGSIPELADLLDREAV